MLSVRACIQLSALQALRPLVAEFSLNGETAPLLLSWPELRFSAGAALLRHRFHCGAGSGLPPATLHLLPARGGLLALLLAFLLALLLALLLLSRAAGSGCAGRAPPSSEGARLQAPPAAGQLLLLGIQELHGAGHQPPCAPPPRRRLKTSCCHRPRLCCCFCLFLCLCLNLFFFYQLCTGYLS